MIKYTPRKRRNFRAIRRIAAGCLIIAVSIVMAALQGCNTAVKQAEISYHRVVVQSGDTLWSLASNFNAAQDTGLLVYKTMEYNNLNSTYIQPGQIIYVPAK